jgi:membrane protein required for colicin V production
MNTIDIVIILLLLWGAINGFIKGFVIQISTLIALVLGIWAAAEFYKVIGLYLTKTLSVSPGISGMVAFVIIFIVILLIMYLLSRGLTNMMGKSVAGRLNRIGGIIFGLAKAVFLISILIFIIQKIDFTQKLLTSEKKEESKLFKPISQVAPAIFPHLHWDKIKENFSKKEN